MRIGIVVCNYNVQQVGMPTYIGSVLSGLAAQSFPGKLDVLVVDNMSSPAFLRTLGAFCQANSNDKRSFSYISEPAHQTLWGSLNLGFHALKLRGDYDIYGYSSDDVWFKPSDTHGLERAAREFDDPSLGIVSVQTNIDNAERSYKNLNSISGSSVKLKLWEIINLHFMLFSNEFMNTNASIDHINPKSPYPKLSCILDNIRWVNERINRMKQDMNKEEFLNMIEKILKHTAGSVEMLGKCPN